jgi:HMG (high mobility group) box
MKLPIGMKWLATIKSGTQSLVGLNKLLKCIYPHSALQKSFRFVREKAAYKGPWPVLKRRAKKDPHAPRRPPSAFLAFSKITRPKIKADNPNMQNTDISRLLGKNTCVEFFHYRLIVSYSQ